MPMQKAASAFGSFVFYSIIIMQYTKGLNLIFSVCFYFAENLYIFTCILETTVSVPGILDLLLKVDLLVYAMQYFVAVGRLRLI